MVERISVCPDAKSWRARILARIESPSGPDDCWRWLGTLDRYGYGTFHIRENGQKRMTGTHRAAWLAFRGEIPYPLVTDHLCRNRACVNPWHLELVTNQINSLRGDHADTGRPRGSNRGCGKHGYVDDGYFRSGRDGYIRWVCRPCVRAGMARYKERQAALK